MSYQDLLEQVPSEWREDFVRFLEDEEPSLQFEEQLDRDPSLQLLMDAAIERKVPSREGDLRRLFWADVTRVNDAVADKLESAIEKRLATPGVLETTEAAGAIRPSPAEVADDVAVIEREIEELAVNLQAASSSVPSTRRESVALMSSAVRESIGVLASEIVKLAVRRAAGR